MLRKILLAIAILVSPLVFAAPAAADETALGPYFCGDCSFGGDNMPYTSEVSTFIRTTVNPDLGPSGWRVGNENLSVIICNATACAEYEYQSNGTHIQRGEEEPNENKKEDYKNPGDAPADPSPGSGGGGGIGYNPGGTGGGTDWWSVCQFVLCVDGRNRTGTVTVGEPTAP